MITASGQEFSIDLENYNVEFFNKLSQIFGTSSLQYICFVDATGETKKFGRTGQLEVFLYNAVHSNGDIKVFQC